MKAVLAADLFDIERLGQNAGDVAEDVGRGLMASVAEVYEKSFAGEEVGVDLKTGFRWEAEEGGGFLSRGLRRHLVSISKEATALCHKVTYMMCYTRRSPVHKFKCSRSEVCAIDVEVELLLHWSRVAEPDIDRLGGPSPNALGCWQDLDTICRAIPGKRKTCNFRDSVRE